VSNSIAELSVFAEKHMVSFIADLPELMSLVMASPEQLAEVLKTILLVLINDAVSETSIKIRVMSSGAFVHYHFHNNGFGLPTERLHEYLHGDVDIVIDEFRRLRMAFRQVQAWGGTFDASTELGKGMVFELKLRGFF
jgi:signal transduction histidine kinase